MAMQAVSLALEFTGLHEALDLGAVLSLEDVQFYSNTNLGGLRLQLVWAVGRAAATAVLRRAGLPLTLFSPCFLQSFAVLLS